MFDDVYDGDNYGDGMGFGGATLTTTTAPPIAATTASPIATTYFVNEYDVDIQIKAKDSIAYIESMSREELVAFKNELSKVEKNMELEEQIDELLDESIRRI